MSEVKKKGAIYITTECVTFYVIITSTVLTQDRRYLSVTLPQTGNVQDGPVSTSQIATTFHCNKKIENKNQEIFKRSFQFKNVRLPPY